MHPDFFPIKAYKSNTMAANGQTNGHANGDAQGASFNVKVRRKNFRAFPKFGIRLSVSMLTPVDRLD